jgi:hypothetical protein
MSNMVFVLSVLGSSGGGEGVIVAGSSVGAGLTGVPAPDWQAARSSNTLRKVNSRTTISPYKGGVRYFIPRAIAAGSI